MNIEQTRNKSQNIFHNASLVLRLKGFVSPFIVKGHHVFSLFRGGKCIIEHQKKNWLTQFFLSGIMAR